MTEYVTHMGDEKYFEYDGLVYDDETGQPVDAKDIVKMLNENEQLKSVDRITDLETTIMQLKSENKQLRCIIEDYSQDDYVEYLKGIITDYKSRAECDKEIIEDFLLI